MKIKFYCDKIGMFSNIEYSTVGGVVRAIGRFVSIDEEGYILIEHLEDSKRTWRFHYSKIVSEYFEDIRDEKK